MIILTLRTDKPEAEIGIYDDTKQLAYETWLAHRSLAETLHAKVIALLETQGKILSDLEGVVCYEGPGSFTGLRIGMTVGNALAYSYSIPIVAVGETQSSTWQDVGIGRIVAGISDTVALPKYGMPAIVTTQKK